MQEVSSSEKVSSSPSSKVLPSSEKVSSSKESSSETAKSIGPSKHSLARRQSSYVSKDDTLRSGSIGEWRSMSALPEALPKSELPKGLASALQMYKGTEEGAEKALKEDGHKVAPLACGSIASSISKIPGRGLTQAVVSATAAREVELDREKSATCNFGCQEKIGQPSRRVFKRLAQKLKGAVEDSEEDDSDDDGEGKRPSKDVPASAKGGRVRATTQPVMMTQKQEGSEKTGKDDQGLSDSESEDSDDDWKSWKTGGTSSSFASEGGRSPSGTQSIQGMQNFLGRRSSV